MPGGDNGGVIIIPHNSDGSNGSEQGPFDKTTFSALWNSIPSSAHTSGQSATMFAAINTILSGIT